jgi:DNA-binding MurR/RpiR family transcriptional regulator
MGNSLLVYQRARAERCSVIALTTSAAEVLAALSATALS